MIACVNACFKNDFGFDVFDAVEHIEDGHFAVELINQRWGGDDAEYVNLADMRDRETYICRVLPRIVTPEEWHAKEVCYARTAYYAGFGWLIKVGKTTVGLKNVVARHKKKERSEALAAMMGGDSEEKFMLKELRPWLVTDIGKEYHYFDEGVLEWIQKMMKPVSSFQHTVAKCVAENCSVRA